MRASQAAAGQTVVDECKVPPAVLVIFGASGDLTTVDESQDSAGRAA
jgi:hypothetical protein